jgi:hypothetical protein
LYRISVQRVSELLPRRPISAQHAVTQQIRGDEGYFIYAPLTGEMDFGCYVGYGLRNADSYPRIKVGLYADPGAAGREGAIEAITRVSSLADWEDNLDDRADWPEFWRETSLVNLLPEEDHVVALKRFFVQSIDQLRGELTGRSPNKGGLVRRISFTLSR